MGACLRLVLLLLLWPPRAQAFSALTHLALVDSCWASGIVPVLIQRYPTTTPAQLREARSYAYGGALIQDLGYFPGNAPLFSNLTHYVRTGDFVRALLDEARDGKELAFALGALAHYAADATGHPTGTNAVTKLVFPELRALPGARVTYAQAPRQHSQVEFAFDVAQVQAGFYRSEEFHAAIGLRVSRALLARAFAHTYGLPLGKLLLHERAGITAFRFVATELLPAAVRASEFVPAGQVRKLSLPERTRYYERINSGHFRRRGGPRPDHLSLGMHVLVVLAPALPRLGVATLLAFRPLPPLAVETMQASFSQALLSYQQLLMDGERPLPNLNLDTGQLIQAAAYPLTDRTYDAWVRRLARTHFSQLTPAVRQHIGGFYAQAAVSSPPPRRSKQVLLDVRQLTTAAAD